MRTVTLEELLEAGCHFGHQVNRKNPRAEEFIFEARAHVHIINLEKTQEGLMNAAKYLKDVASSGKKIVVVGTKRQARTIVRNEVLKARREGAENVYFVTSRWIGGTLTNHEEVSKNFKRLNELNELLRLPEKQKDYTKRELLQFERERDKLKNFYEGIVDMDGLPDVLLVVDTKHESTAVDEARLKDVPVVGVVDTNSDPLLVDYPIPSNDDAVGAVKLLASFLLEVWLEGEKDYHAGVAKKKEEEKKAEAKREAEEQKKKEAAALASKKETEKKKTITKK